MHLARALFFAVAAAAVVATTAAAASDTLEVVEARGIIDGPVEGAIVTALETAERTDARALLLQIDSRGTLGADRATRLTDRILEADVPVITWIGPPGARAENGAVPFALAGDVTVMSPGSALGPVGTLDLRSEGDAGRVAALLARTEAGVIDRAYSAEGAEDAGLVDEIAVQLPDVLRELEIDAADLTIRFRKPDLWGRVLHGMAQPSIAYLVLLLGLVGLVFEIFHPSTGPAGLSGLAALALAGYGLVVLDASWVGIGFIVAGVVAFSIDLRFEGLGVFTLAGFGALIAGSLVLFGGPWLRINPWVLGVGVVGMTAFMVGAMTRVLRDLRAIARGELEVREPHAP